MKRTLQWQAVAGLALAMVMGATSAAQAKPPADDQSGSMSSIARTSDGRAVVSEAVAKDVVAYWTPERMAAAVNLDLVKVTSATASSIRDRKPSGPPMRTEPAAPTVADHSGFATLVVPTASITVGKVFATLPGGGSGMCSAATLNTGKKRLVVTAGHCVHQGAGGRWLTNWQFVPGYRNGVRPYGTWAASELTARTAWINTGDPAEDLGIAIMNTNGAGQRIVDVVGGNGSSINYGYSINITSFGYPEAINNGQTLQYCQGPTSYLIDQLIVMPCNMTQGASGGPWMRLYDNSTGYGYINGVNSLSNLNGSLVSPYFDDTFKELMLYAEGRSPF